MDQRKAVRIESRKFNRTGSKSQRSMGNQYSERHLAACGLRTNGPTAGEGWREATRAKSSRLHDRTAASGASAGRARSKLETLCSTAGARRWQQLGQAALTTAATLSRNVSREGAGRSGRVLQVALPSAAASPAPGLARVGLGGKVPSPPQFQICAGLILDFCVVAERLARRRTGNCCECNTCWLIWCEPGMKSVEPRGVVAAGACGVFLSGSRGERELQPRGVVLPEA